MGLGGVVQDGRQSLRMEVDLPGDGVDRRRCTEEPQLLPEDVARQVPDAGLEVGVPCHGVVATAVEILELPGAG